jgi:hypothetical protein
LQKCLFQNFEKTKNDFRKWKEHSSSYKALDGAAADQPGVITFVLKELKLFLRMIVLVLIDFF